MYKLNLKRITSAAALAALMAVSGSAVAEHYGGCGGKAKDTGMEKAQMDIVDIAASAGSFNTLVGAVKEADLVDTLKSDGPFTVFAPTDEAFAKLPDGQLEELLQDKEALTKVLTYHVVPGKVTSEEVVNLQSAKTVEGQSVKISVGDDIRVDNAKIIKADIMASNGVIHVIDTVILPN